MSSQIEVLPGGHLVAGAGGVVVVVAHRGTSAVTADSVAARALTELLGIVRQAGTQEPRRRGRTVARLATNWLMGLENGDEDEVEFGVITPGDGGIAVFLHGGVTAVLAGVERSELLRGREAGFTVDRVVTPAPGVGAGLFVDEVGAEIEMLPTRGVFALTEGTAPGAGAVLWFATADRGPLAEDAPRAGFSAQPVSDAQHAFEPWREAAPNDVFAPSGRSDRSGASDESRRESAPRDVFDPSRMSDPSGRSDRSGASDPSRLSGPRYVSDPEHAPSRSAESAPQHISDPQDSPDPSRISGPQHASDPQRPSDPSTVSGPQDISDPQRAPEPQYLSDQQRDIANRERVLEPRDGSDPRSASDPSAVSGSQYISDPQRTSDVSRVSGPQHASDPQQVSNLSAVSGPEHIADPQHSPEPPYLSDPQRVPDLWTRDESLDAATENYSTSAIPRELESPAQTGGEPPHYSEPAHFAAAPSDAPPYSGAPGYTASVGDESSSATGEPSNATYAHGTAEPGSAGAISDESSSSTGESTGVQRDSGAAAPGSIGQNARFPSGAVPASSGARSEESSTLGESPSFPGAGMAGSTELPYEGSSSRRVPPGAVTPPHPHHSYGAGDAEWPSEESSSGSATPPRQTGSSSANPEWASQESPAVRPALPHIAMPNLHKPARAGQTEDAGTAYSSEQPGIAQHESGAHDEVQGRLSEVDFQETMISAESLVARVLDSAAIPEADPPGVVVKGFKCARDHLNDPRVSFCAVCGIRMDQLTCVLTDGVRPPLGLLLLDDGTSFVLDNDCVLGREPEHAEAVAHGARPVRLEDLSGGMSRAHAEIRLIDWDVTVVDGGSTNGTHVRQPGHQDWTRAIPGHPMKLTPGAQVQLGGRVVTFDSQHGQL
ncbi:FHA domain-containing protein [Nocardia sp. NPDC050175]|uniref:FHA domain-containing protein n=1 Tax=Nocardia sp. NPDC050175 TaxID=3364317 RepID=UPI0037B4A33D